MEYGLDECLCCGRFMHSFSMEFCLRSPMTWKTMKNGQLAMLMFFPFLKQKTKNVIKFINYTESFVLNAIFPPEQYTDDGWQTSRLPETKDMHFERHKHSIASHQICTQYDTFHQSQQMRLNFIRLHNVVDACAHWFNGNGHDKKGSHLRMQKRNETKMRRNYNDQKIDT